MTVQTSCVCIITQLYRQQLYQTITITNNKEIYMKTINTNSIIAVGWVEYCRSIVWIKLGQLNLRISPIGNLYFWICMCVLDLWPTRAQIFINFGVRHFHDLTENISDLDFQIIAWQLHHYIEKLRIRVAVHLCLLIRWNSFL